MNAEIRLTQEYLKAYPLEVVKQLETWPASAVAEVMRPLPPEDVASVLEFATADMAGEVLLLLPRDQAAAVVALLSTASAIDVMRQFNPDVQGEFFSRLDPSVGPGLRMSLAYPDGTAASLADPRVTTLPPDITVSAALERIKHASKRATYYHYVVERDGVLAGLVTTKELLVADQDQVVATVMRDQVESIAADTLEGEVLQDPNWRLYHTLPVVDKDRRFLGTLRYRTLKRIEEQFAASTSPGSLPHSLLHMWEAFALIGMRIMTDLAQAAETGLSAVTSVQAENREVPHDRSPKTS
jgi:magnesium transporter